MAGGFYKVPHEVHRALSGDPNTFRVFCELASRARWAAGAYLGSHGIVELAIGQCAIGRAELAADLGLTERAVRTALDRLSRLRAVTVETSKRGTVVTVHEYSANAEQVPSERPSVDAEIDQAPAGQTTISATCLKEPRSKDKNEKGESADAPATEQREVLASELASAAVDAINTHAGTRYEADSTETLRNARALLKAKVTPDDVRAVVAAKWRDWGADDKMRPHFRPSTLLRTSNFLRYREDLAAGSQRRPAIAAGSAPPANNFGTEMRGLESGLDAVLRIARGES